MVKNVASIKSTKQTKETKETPSAKEIKGQEKKTDFITAAKKVFRETASLRPFKVTNSYGEINQSVYERTKNELKIVRRKIAGIAFTEPHRVGAPLTPKDDAESQREFAECEDAASNPIYPDDDEDHFIIWTSEDSESPDPSDGKEMTGEWPYTEIPKLSKTYGPFMNNTKAKSKKIIYVFFYKGIGKDNDKDKGGNQKKK